jgi:hypothetical protein
MSTESLTTPPTEEIVGSVQSGKSRLLGVIGFVIALLLLILFAVYTGLAYSGVLINFGGLDYYGAIAIQSIGYVVPFLLGLIAAITKRGRYWGISAIAISVSANYYVYLLVIQGINYLIYPGMGAPSWY